MEHNVNTQNHDLADRNQLAEIEELLKNFKNRTEIFPVQYLKHFINPFNYSIILKKNSKKLLLILY